MESISNNVSAKNNIFLTNNVLTNKNLRINKNPTSITHNTILSTQTTPINISKLVSSFSAMSRFNLHSSIPQNSYITDNLRNWAIDVKVENEIFRIPIPDSRLSIQWLQEEIQRRLLGNNILLEINFSSNLEVCKLQTENGATLYPTDIINTVLSNGSMIKAILKEKLISEKMENQQENFISSIISKETKNLLLEYNNCLLTYKNYCKNLKMGEKASFPEEIINQFKLLYHLCSQEPINEKKKEMKKDIEEYLQHMGVGNTIENHLTSYCNSKERIFLKQFPKFEENLHKMESSSLLSFYNILYEETISDEEDIKKKILNWNGIHEDSKVLEFYNQIINKISNLLPKSFVLLLCNLLGCLILMPGKVIKIGKVSKPHCRKYSLSDPFEIMVKHLAVLLTVPNLNAISLDYKFIREYRKNNNKKKNNKILTEEQVIKLLSSNLHGNELKKKDNDNSEKERITSDEEILEQLEQDEEELKEQKRKRENLDDVDWKPYDKCYKKKKKKNHQNHEKIIQNRFNGSSNSNLDLIPKNPENLTILEAAVQVLAEQRRKGIYALKINEIWDLIVKSKILETKSKTPKSSLSARLTEEVRKMGEKSVVVRVGPGLYSLRNVENKISTKIEKLINTISLNHLNEKEKEYIIEKILDKQNTEQNNINLNNNIEQNNNNTKNYINQEENIKQSTKNIFLDKTK